LLCYAHTGVSTCDCRDGSVVYQKVAALEQQAWAFIRCGKDHAAMGAQACRVHCATWNVRGGLGLPTGASRTKPLRYASSETTRRGPHVSAPTPHHSRRLEALGSSSRGSGAGAPNIVNVPSPNPQDVPRRLLGPVCGGLFPYLGSPRETQPTATATATASQADRAVPG
jgi:hypothetical protein